MPQGVDGVELGGLAGGVIAAAEAHDAAEEERDATQPQGRAKGRFEVSGDHVAYPDAHKHTEDATEDADDDHLNEELCSDGLGRGAEGLAQSNFAGALRDGDQHDVGQANGRAEQG